MYVRFRVDPSYLVLALCHKTRFGRERSFTLPRSILQLLVFRQADNANSGMWAGIAICGGGKVLKVTPEAHVVGEISFPNARMITCPAFVEDDLFITSAVEEEPAKFPDSVKFGGSLWKVHVGVKGMPVHKFRWR